MLVMNQILNLPNIVEKDAPSEKQVRCKEQRENKKKNESWLTCVYAS